MKRVKLSKADITINSPVQWSIYASNGQLLLRQGSVIKSEEVLNKLLQHDPFRNVEMILSTTVPHHGKVSGSVEAEIVNPFNQITRFSTRYKNMMSDLQKLDTSLPKRFSSLAEDIQHLVAYDEDACLGAIHIYYDQKYLSLQPIYKAIICELTATILGYDAETRLPLICAALTANLALNSIQERLDNQASPLTDKQRKLIQEAPARSVEILKRLGVTDEEWLKTVIQNHERNDGSGYPWGLKSKFISPFAKILGLADTYVAMINKRAYRKAVLPQTVLKEIYQMSSEEDEEIFRSFVSQLGVYPPGTLVKLTNGEIAVVTNRGFGGSIMSQAMAIGSEPGKYYVLNQKRDTSDPEYKIEGLFNPATKPGLNPDTLWEYE